jgi:hypothetical protein
MINTALTDIRKQELREICSRMQSTSNTFYSGAVMTGNHAFIEFTGLINEYVKACYDSIEKDVDFTQANVHTGKALPLAPYQLEYIAEKFDCIYGGSFKAVKGKTNV